MILDDLNKAIAKNLGSLTGLAGMASAIDKLHSAVSPGFALAFRELGSVPRVDSLSYLASAISQFPIPNFPRVSFPLHRFPTIPFPKLPTVSFNFGPLNALYSSAFKFPDAFRTSFLSASLLPASLFRSPAPPLAGFAQALAAIAARASLPAGGIATTFVGEELAAIKDVEEVDTLDEIEERLTAVENAIVEKIRKSPLVRVSFEAWLNLLLTLFVFLYSTISSDTFQARLEGKVDLLTRVDERVLESQRKIYEQLSERMQESDITGTLYVTLREAKVRVKPSSKSPITAFLFPNQLVKLEARKGKWIRVSFFDYVDATMRSGWVLKKYLRRVGR